METRTISVVWTCYGLATGSGKTSVLKVLKCLPGSARFDMGHEETSSPLLSSALLVTTDCKRSKFDEQIKRSGRLQKRKKKRLSTTAYRDSQKSLWGNGLKMKAETLNWSTTFQRRAHPNWRGLRSQWSDSDIHQCRAADLSGQTRLVNCDVLWSCSCPQKMNARTYVRTFDLPAFFFLSPPLISCFWTWGWKKSKNENTAVPLSKS